MRQIPVRAVVAALCVGGCTTPSWQDAGLDAQAKAAIERYYAARAVEKNGRCSAPVIDGFTRVEKVEEGPEQVVVATRYLYRDLVKDGGRGDRRCLGYGNRRFVLAKVEAGLAVVEMDGPQRR